MVKMVHLYDVFFTTIKKNGYWRKRSLFSLSLPKREIRGLEMSHFSERNMPRKRRPFIVPQLIILILLIIILLSFIVYYFSVMLSILYKFSHFQKFRRSKNDYT